MREFINKYGAYIAAGAVVLTAILFYFFGFSGQPSVPTHAYYVDEATGQESVQPINSLPPLPGKDGKPTLVQVIKVSCDGGKNPPATVYYRKYSPEAKEKIEELRGTSDPTKQTQMDDWMSRGEMLRDPAPGSPWVYALSDAGEKLREKALCTNGQVSRVVYPP